MLGDRTFHLVAHDWGSVQSWESVTSARFAGRILSYSTISGPCLDHLGHWLREQAKHHPLQAIKSIQKSWYVGAFHLPLLPQLFWSTYSPERSQRLVARLEQSDDIPVNRDINQNGRYGLALYRANMLPRALKPRHRYAQCPVQAIILTQDYFVPPSYIHIMQVWCSDWQTVEVVGNHWAILSQPKPIAEAIRAFALKQA